MLDEKYIKKHFVDIVKMLKKIYERKQRKIFKINGERDK